MTPLVAAAIAFAVGVVLTELIHRTDASAAARHMRRLSTRQQVADALLLLGGVKGVYSIKEVGSSTPTTTGAIVASGPPQ